MSTGKALPRATGAFPAGSDGGENEAPLCPQSPTPPPPAPGAPLDLRVLSSEAVDSPRAVRNTWGSSPWVLLQLRERCRGGAVSGEQRPAQVPPTAQSAPPPARALTAAPKPSVARGGARPTATALVRPCGRPACFLGPQAGIRLYTSLCVWLCDAPWCGHP